MPKTRAAVKQPTAEIDIFISLASFGLTVVLTRIFLQLTGYPQLGNSVLHIAHALWGGLFLFASGLLPLVLANRWAYTAGALLNGIGVGLFIDEVGKFITQKNDYFYAPAAPLIYSIFLLGALLFLLVRRSRPATPRASMYRALLGLREILDDDLNPHERERLLADLAGGSQASQPHIASLARGLQDYLHNASVPLVAYRPDIGSRLYAWLRRLGRRFGRNNHRRLIVTMMALLGINALLTVFFLLWAWWDAQAADLILSTLLLEETELTIQRPIWLVVRLALQLIVGLLYALAFIWHRLGREKPAVDIALFAALLSITAVHLLTFYLNQFGSLTGLFWNLVQFLLLLAYRSWYLTNHPAFPAAE